MKTLLAVICVVASIANVAKADMLLIDNYQCGDYVVKTSYAGKAGNVNTSEVLIKNNHVMQKGATTISDAQGFGANSYTDYSFIKNVNDGYSITLVKQTGGADDGKAELQIMYFAQAEKGFTYTPCKNIKHYTDFNA